MTIHHATPFLLSASLFFGLGAVATAASDGSTHASGASSPSTQHRTPQATQGSGKPQNPGTIRGFNPQPEPPGTPAAPAAGPQ